MRFRIGDAIALIFWVAAVYVLVRPKSKAAELVGAMGRAGVAMVRRATDTANT